MIEVDLIGDPELLSALHREAFEKGWDATACKEILDMPGCHCWVSSISGEPAGFLVIRTVADEGEIITVGVLPSRRRTGLASTMLAEARRQLPECERLFLEVSERNEAARTLYRSSGFRESGRRKRYYADGSDAVVMVLDR